MNSSLSPDQQSLVHETLEMLSTFRTNKSNRVHDSDWDYVDAGEEWFKICSQGVMQSPVSIDLSNIVRISSIGAHYYPFSFNYSKTTEEGAFVDKTFRINFQGNEADLYTLSGTNRKFFTQFIEFHAPAEHVIKGKQKALEMHIFHKEQISGNLFILAVLFKLSNTHNTFIQEIINGENFDLSEIVGEKPEVFVYFGSETHPPCSETVLWAICTEVKKISFEQVKFFSSKWENNQAFARGHGNNRAIQSLNNRVVLDFY